MSAQARHVRDGALQHALVVLNDIAILTPRSWTWARVVFATDLLQTLAIVLDRGGALGFSHATALAAAVYPIGPGPALDSVERGQVWAVSAVSAFLLAVLVLFARAALMHKQKRAEASALAVRLLRPLVLLLVTVLYVPSLAALAAKARHNTFGDGNTGPATATGGAVAAVAAALLVTASTAVVGTLFDTDPYSEAVMCRPHARCDLAHHGARTAAVALLVMWRGGAVGDTALTVCLVLLFAASAYGFASFLPYFRAGVSAERAVVSCVAAWACACGVVASAQPRGDAAASLLLYLGAPIVAVTAHMAVGARVRWIRAATVSRLRNPYELELKGRFYLEEVERESEREANAATEALLNHGEAASEAEKGAAGGAVGGAKGSGGGCPFSGAGVGGGGGGGGSAQREAALREVDRWYQYGVRRFERSSTGFLFRALFHFYRDRNKQRSMMQLVVAEAHQPVWDEAMVIRKLRELHETTLNETTEVLQSYLRYREHVVAAEEADLEASKTRVQFWTAMTARPPNLEQVQESGCELNAQAAVARHHYEAALAIFNRSPQVLRMFGSFLADVINDDARATKLFEQAEDIENSRTKRGARPAADSRMDIFDETNSVLVIDNARVMGEITSVNAGAARMFGYTRGELATKNINVIVPSPYQDFHDDFLRAYIETGRNHIIDSTRDLFAARKSGHIFPIKINVQQISRTSFLGLVREVDTGGDMHMFAREDGSIYTWTVGCATVFPALGEVGREVPAAICLPEFHRRRADFERPDGAATQAITCGGDARVSVQVTRVRVRAAAYDHIRVRVEDAAVALQSVALGGRCGRLSSVIGGGVLGGATGSGDDDSGSSSCSLPDFGSISAADSDDNDDVDGEGGGDGGWGARSSAGTVSPMASPPMSPCSAGRRMLTLPEEAADEKDSDDEEDERSPCSSPRSPRHVGFVAGGATLPAAGRSKRRSSTLVAAARLKDLEMVPLAGKRGSGESSSSRPRSPSVLKRRAIGPDCGDNLSAVPSSVNNSGGKSAVLSLLSKNSAASSANMVDMLREVVLSERSSDRAGFFLLRAFFTTISLMIIALATVSFVLSNHALHLFERETEFTNLAEERSFAVFDTTDSVRRLELVRLGLMPPDTEQWSRDSLLGNSDGLEGLQSALYLENDGLTDAQRLAVEVARITVLESYVPGEVVSELWNLHQTVGAFVSKARLVHEDALADIDSELSPNAFFLRHNAEGSTLDALNVSSLLFRSEAASVAEGEVVAESIILAVAMGLGLAVLLVAGPIISRVQAKNSAVLQLFATVPRGMARELAKESVERVASLSGGETSADGGDSGGDGDGFDANDVLGEPAADGGGNPDEAAVAAAASVAAEAEKPRRGGRSNDAGSKRRRMLNKVALFVVVTLPYFAGVYVWNSRVIDTIPYFPLEVQVAGERLLAVKGATFAVREMAAASGNATARDEWQARLHELSGWVSATHSALLYGNADLGLRGSVRRNAEHDALLFRSNCFEGAPAGCDEIYDGLNTHGLDAALMEFQRRLHVLYASDGAALSLASDDAVFLDTMERLYLREGLVHSKELYMNEGNSDVESFLKARLWLLVSFCVVLALMFQFIYVRLINGLQADFTGTRSLLLLLPIRLMNSVAPIRDFVRSASQGAGHAAKKTRVRR